MGRRTRAIGGAAVALLGLALTTPAAGAQSAGSVGIDDTGVPPKCGTNPYCFLPSSVTISAGGTVTWTDNSANAPHTVTADPSSAEQFGSGNLTQGYTFRHTFNSPGTFTYHCSIHTYMTGSITVTGTAVSSSSSSTASHTTSATHTTTAASTTSSSTSAHAATTSTTSTAPPPATSAPVAAAGNSSSQASATPSATVAASAGAAPPETGGGSAAGWVIAAMAVVVVAAGGGIALRGRRRPM